MTSVSARRKVPSFVAREVLLNIPALPPARLVDKHGDSSDVLYVMSFFVVSFVSPFSIPYAAVDRLCVVILPF